MWPTTFNVSQRFKHHQKVYTQDTDFCKAPCRSIKDVTSEYLQLLLRTAIFKHWRLITKRHVFPSANTWNKILDCFHVLHTREPMCVQLDEVSSKKRTSVERKTQVLWRFYSTKATQTKNGWLGHFHSLSALSDQSSAIFLRFYQNYICELEKVPFYFFTIPMCFRSCHELILIN